MVSLTQVKKKGKDHKSDIIEEIRENLKEFEHVYVLSYHNMTTNPFKKIKQDFKDSVFFLGKNKLAAFALGKSQDDEPLENSSLLSKYLTGQCCLLFTNKKEKLVEDYFSKYSSKDFANAGTIAPTDIVLKKGFEAFEHMSYAIEPHLREL